MGTYDDWKTRSDRDDAPQWEEAEGEQMDEDEYAIHDAEQAFAVLVDRFGATRAKQMMFAIFLRYGLDDIKARAARPEVKEQLK